MPDSFDNAPLSARSHLETIASAKEGQRNDTLNKSCFSIGQLITQGYFTKKEIIKYIYAAAETTGLPTAEYFKTIQNGIQAGKDSPKSGASALNRSLKELNVFPWPIVDRAMFYGFAGEFVEFATEYSEADPIAVLATFLSRFGVEVGRSPFVLAGEQQHARVNAVLVGQSSKARKGTSFMPIRELFKFSEDEWKLSHVSHGPLSSGEGLIFAVRDERTEYIVDRQKGSGKDVTVDLGIKDKRLFVLDQEFAGALSCSKRDGNTLSSIIRALFDGHKVEPLTKTSKITATDPHVAIVTHITTYELSSKMDTVEAFNGFANRFLWLCVRRPKLVAFPTALDEKKLQSFRMRLLDILKSSVEYNEICFDSEARTLWADIYPSLSQDRPGLPGANEQG
ncbi:hypothetical protein [Desulfovibrio sp. UCD-KL4C]|uniref:hypothetical protein n=1 Tax=Desulfovibrio sp. UCD-KL4C TaxID=2578120 RepID=UPI0025C5E72B|nr:hypothetical protein [Desulfovibrio sp. UCD-KL4C]